MKIKFIIVCLFYLFILAGCSGIIYAIRGPKYKGKFVAGTYPNTLDSTCYYYTTYDYSNRYYAFEKFGSNGVFHGLSSKGKPLTILELDTLTPHRNYFVFKNGYLRWEVYFNGYEGFELYKAKVYGDSIVAWQPGRKRTTRKTYYKIN
ncbi:MAG TPA: hypothetical protein PLS08_12805 [Chryseolinea sp.]|nr:hypothetical protein [Chryseolinea sp.]